MKIWVVRDGDKEYAAPTTPYNEKRHSRQVVPSPKKGVDARDALCTVYITYRPEGNRLAVRCHVSASVASAPRGGVACNDAATRQEGPILGWVRDARVRSQTHNDGRQ